MTPVAHSQVQSQESDPDVTTRIGGWLFRHRSSIPVPLAIAVLLLRIGEMPPSAALIVSGIFLTFLGELLRLWAVHHIGAISRTRSGDRLGPLVMAGPFAFVRNPLYLGNIALWTGFALAAQLVWLVPIIVLLLGFEYHAIVRWEERLLEARLGEDYRAYATRVPRWIPALSSGAHVSHGERVSTAPSAVMPFSSSETLFSERGTLLAIAAGYVLLWLKARF